METVMDPARPCSGDARVCAAVALGWQVATLYHSPRPQGAVGDPARGERLPGRSGFTPATQEKWLGEQIAAGAATLLTEPRLPLREALNILLTHLDKDDPDRTATLEAVFAVHCRLFEALTVADFRLGKAYGLGRAMAETALVPANAGDADGDAMQKFRELLEDGRLTTVKNWLTALKTMLPDHSAYATSRGLDEWHRWAGEPRTADDWKRARTDMRLQGYLWRELLTGEKAGKDLLNAAGYLAAAWQVARRAWWLFAGMVAVAVAVVLVVLLVPGLSRTVRLAAVLAWLGATLAAGMKAVGPLIGSAVKGAEGWLWQTELDESVAAAATRMPPHEKHQRITGPAVGEMTLHPEEAGAAAPLAPPGGAAGPGRPGLT
jgi:hypothetical protein